MGRRDKRFNPNQKIKQLEKQNRILRRQLKQAHNDLKVDIKAERHYYMKVGYDQCKEQILTSTILSNNKDHR